MRCEQALELIAAATDSPKDPAVDAHLDVCPQCRVRASSAAILGRRLRDPLLWEEPDPAMEDRIMAALRADPPGRIRSTRSWLGVAAGLILAVVVSLVLMNRPEWQVELVAGPESPEATATVRGWNKGAGTRMMFDVSGLEELDEGFYEIWMTALDGTHVSAGSFTAPGRFEVTVGVHRADFPRIWVTVEAADGDLSPTPRTVLDTPTGDA